MHRFFAAAPGQDGLCLLDAEESHHAQRVLRLRPGDMVELLLPTGIVQARLEQMDTRGCAFLPLQALPSREPQTRVTVFQALPKAEKLELVLQKCVEIGACALAPLKLERCVTKLDHDEGVKRQSRLARIALEAQKQCGRHVCPQVYEPMTLAQAEQLLLSQDLLLTLWEEQVDHGLRTVLAARPNAVSIGLVIGPEGGLTKTEVDWLAQRGAVTVTLGPRILRTETAALAALAAVLALRGDLGA